MPLPPIINSSEAASIISTAVAESRVTNIMSEDTLMTTDVLSDDRNTNDILAAPIEEDKINTIQTNSGTVFMIIVNDQSGLKSNPNYLICF